MTSIYDVVVVGNGMLGCATALELVRTDPGLRVAVVGPANRTGGASAAAGAMLNCFGEVTHTTLSSEPGRTKLEMSLQALEAWPAWLDELNAELADDRRLAIREGTFVLLNSCGGQLDSLNYRAIVEALRSYGRKYEILPLGEVPNLDPATNARPLEAVHLPQEGAIDARAVLDRVVELVGRRKVTFVDDRVVGWRQEGGHAIEVVLGSGATVPGGRFLVAAGASTQVVVDDLKDAAAPLVPMFAGIGVAVTCRATASGLQHVVRSPNRSGGCGLHLVPGDGTVYLGATNDVRLQPDTWSSLGMAHFLLGGAMEQFDRRLFGSPVVTWHVGNRPLSLDGYPVIGRLWQDNVWVLSGTYRDGFHCSPVLARHAADTLLGGPGMLGHDLFAPLRTPLRTMTREQAVDEMVRHCVSQFYQYSPRLAPWMRVSDGVELQVRAKTEATYRELGSDFGLAPELLELLNWGDERKRVVASFRRYLHAASDAVGMAGASDALVNHGRGWTGDELLRTGAHWVVPANDVVVRMRRGLPEVFEPPTSATLAAFRARMEWLVGDVAVAVARRLGPGGPGLAVVAHDELEAMSDGQLTALAFGVSVLLGRLTRQRFPDDFLVVVEDRRPDDVSTAPGYQSNGRMGMHTDPTDAAVLACLTASAAGGESLFASAVAVHDVLAREAPTVLDRFRRSWTWDLRGAQRPGTDPLVESPVFGPDSNEVRCRFGWLLLHEGARVTGGLTPDVAAALELFEEVARRPELTLRHRLRRGESVWIDNYRVLHAREAFEDRQDTGVARRLIRIWLWLHEGISLPTDFAAFSAAIDRGSLG